MGFWLLLVMAGTHWFGDRGILGKSSFVAIAAPFGEFRHHEKKTTLGVTVKKIPSYLQQWGKHYFVAGRQRKPSR